MTISNPDDLQMETRQGLHTWKVGDCTISCESRIFIMVISERELEQEEMSPAPVRAVKTDQTHRRRAKRPQ